MASSSISSASCCRGAQLLEICQSEVWSHMFLESLASEFVSIWAPLTFSIGKLQKLALSGWAWNFVSFLGISCSNHSGTLFSLGVWAWSWRSNPFSSLASSSLHWALELQTPIAQALRQIWPRHPLLNAAMTGSAAALKNAATDEDQTRHHTSCPPIFGAKKVREKICFANRATDLPNSVLSRSLNYWKVLDGFSSEAIDFGDGRKWSASTKVDN